jgi:endonuclease I
MAVIATMPSVDGKPVIAKLADGTKVELTVMLDTQNDSFEPPNRAKGQVAQMIFYMLVRY